MGERNWTPGAPAGPFCSSDFTRKWPFDARPPSGLLRPQRTRLTIPVDILFSEEHKIKDDAKIDFRFIPI